MWSNNGEETQPSGGLHPDHLDQAAVARGGKDWWRTSGTPPGQMARQTISESYDGKREPIRELPSVSE